ncbi:MAG: hypothetical protein NTY46_13155 [Candidatus Sumerlaeota bacterium]|nr:hypothetical protein [Candidatus Sumerlaeota bacterium]
MIFGLVVIVAVVSVLSFRRHSLGTRNRVILSLLAIGLLLAGPLRKGVAEPGDVALIVLTAAVLGSGIIYLWRKQHHPPLE